MCKSSRPIRSLDFSNYYIFWTVQPFLIFFRMKLEYHKTFKTMLSFSGKMPFNLKNGKSGRSSLTKSTFLYIAQNWLICFFDILHKVRDHQGYKLIPTHFLGKFSFCQFWPFFGPVWLKNRLSCILLNIGSLYFFDILHEVRDH